jgi:hypothetical protein
LLKTIPEMGKGIKETDGGDGFKYAVFNIL